MTQDKGSIWRKWDLQVQTILDDAYLPLEKYYEELKVSDPTKWSEYVAKVGGEANAILFDSPKYFNDSKIPKTERVKNYVCNFFAFQGVFNPELSCMAITDHNYDDPELLDVFMQYSLKYPLKVLAGVEINVGGVHMLVLFEKPILKKITYSESIIAFLTTIGITARMTDGVLTPTTSDIKAVIDIVKKNRGIIIFPHCNNSNGLFQERNASDRTILAEAFNYQSMNILQSQNWESCTKVGEFISKAENLTSAYCLTIGSDARSLQDTGKADEKGNYLWIKADCTFEGLRQIFYEPEERLKVQSHNPFEDRKKIYFDSIQIAGSKNFIIPDMLIPLNRELVTIIGGRGSGKSAKLEAIAFLNEEHLKMDSNGKRKIIEYYRHNSDNKEPSPSFTFIVKVVDRDGNTKTYQKSLSELESLGLPFLYIGQEQLSSLATNEKELTKKVCELLNLDSTVLQNSDLVEEAREALSSIEILGQEVQDIVEKYQEYNSEISFEEWLSKYLVKKNAQKDTLTSKQTKDLLEQITKNLDRGMKLKDYYESLEEMKEDLEESFLVDKISELNDLQKQYFKESKNEIPPLDTSVQAKAIEIIQKEVTTEMDALRESIIKSKKALAEMGLKEDINVLIQSAEAIQKEINGIARDLQQYKDKNELLIKKISERNALYGTITSRLGVNKGKINSAFSDFLKSRDGSSQNEKELFESTVKDVSVEGEVLLDQDRLVKFILENCVDNRKLRTIEDVKSTIAGKRADGRSEEITLEKLTAWIKTSLNTFLRTDTLNTGGRTKLLNFLFTQWENFLRVNTVVKLKEVPTEKLSVGQRGTLLLKIYLATATVKQIFIVDQPEDNLDNQFIMKELVPLIRKIKKERQIILTTHNANLVVNTDAEQVIVARLDTDNDYISGGIENPEINMQIRDVLEGGEDAFRARENRYGMGKV